MKKGQPHKHCSEIESLFLDANSITITDYETSFKDITFDLLLEQQQKIYQKLFVEALIYGNVNKNQAENTYLPILDKYVLNDIKEPYITKELYNDNKGCLKLENGVYYLCSFKCPNEEDGNSCISCISRNYLYKSDDTDGANFAVLKLFGHLCRSPCFDELRTKQQLGYIVWSYPSSFKGLYSFKVVIQSNNSSPRKLNCKIETFLKEFRDFIEEIDDETFMTNKKSVINNLLEKTKTINGEKLYHLGNNLTEKRI